MQILSRIFSITGSDIKNLSSYNVLIEKLISAEYRLLHIYFAAEALIELYHARDWSADLYFKEWTNHQLAWNFYSALVPKAVWNSRYIPIVPDCISI